MITARRDFWDGRQLVITLKGSNRTALQGKWLDCGRFAELRPAESVGLGVAGRVITEFRFLMAIPAFWEALLKLKLPAATVCSFCCVQKAAQTRWGASGVPFRP